MRPGFPVLLAAIFQVTAALAITPNAVELSIASKAESHPDQGRSEMVYDARLHVVARAKALDMATRGYFSHTDPDGYGPNTAVATAGYELPSFYLNSISDNYIESIGSGYSSADACFAAWMGSAGHRSHLLGEIPFYAGQTRFGVGYAEVPGSPFTRYYVFVSAPPSGADSAQAEPYVEWKFDRFSTAELDGSNDFSDSDADGIVRVVEFALGGDPKTAEEMPLPTWDSSHTKIEWVLPIRPELGSVTAFVEATSDFKDWSAGPVQVSGDTRSYVPPAGTGFVRFHVSPP